MLRKALEPDSTMPIDEQEATARNQSLARGAAILHVLAAHPEGTSVPAIASAVDLPRTTTRRLLVTLADLGFAERLQTDNEWVLGYEVARLGRAADPFGRFIERSRLALERLAAAASESAMISVVHPAWQAETVLQVDAPNLVGVTNWLGIRFAGLHATAIGKLALAQLPDDLVRAQVERGFELVAYTSHTIDTTDALLEELAKVRREGYAETVDELEDGLTAIVVPLPAETLAATGNVLVVGVGVSGPSFRVTSERRNELLLALLTCADELSALAPTPSS